MQGPISDAENLMIVFTGVIAITGIIGTIVFYYQLSVMQAQLNEMKQSFAADRAYVLNGGFSGFGGQPIVSGIKASFTFTNFGRTPADMRNVGGSCAYSLTGAPEPSNSTAIAGITNKHGDIPVGKVIDSGKNIGPFTLKLEATKDQIDQARLCNGKIYCRAIISYDDMRSNRHETSVCMVFNFGANAFILCPEENTNYRT